jgi:hypothetical protein
VSGNFGPGQPRVPEPSRGMTYDGIVEVAKSVAEEAQRVSAEDWPRKCGIEYVNGWEDAAGLAERIAERLTRNALPVCSVEIIVDKQFAGISPDALGAVKAATGIADVTFEEIPGGTGKRHSWTRVILRPTQREAASLIMTAIYSDVVNGVKQ